MPATQATGHILLRVDLWTVRTDLRLIALIDHQQTGEVTQQVNWLTTSDVMFIKYSKKL